MRIPVGTSSTVIAQGRGSFVIKNKTATASIFLETSDDAGAASATTGFEWETTDGPLSIDLWENEILYGLVSSTQQTVHVLEAVLPE